MGKQSPRKKDTAVHAIGYARVSTAEQGTSGLGLDAQTAAIKAECERQGWELIRIEHDVASGKSTNGRHGLERAMAECEAGAADVLVAPKLDRLARSLVDFVGIFERARKQGWRLAIGDVPIDLSSPMGEALAGVLAVFAQLERRMIGERTAVALAEAKKRGVRIGRPPGFKSNRTPPEARELIVRRRAEGLSYRQIASELTGAGMPTALGRTNWSAEAVRQVVLSST